MKQMGRSVVYAVVVVLSAAQGIGGYLSANPGDLNTDFGYLGTVTTHIGNGNAQARGVAIEPSGKIVAAGYAIGDIGTNVFAVARYRTDGQLDTEFNTIGTVTTKFSSYSYAEAYGIAIESLTNKIVAAGVAFESGSPGVFAIARYRTDGALDSGFNAVGMVTTHIGSSDARAYGIAIESDEKIVAAGYAYNGGSRVFAVARYRTNGVLDTEFNIVGTVTTGFSGYSDAEASGIAIDGDGKIVAAGYAADGDENSVFAVARYRTDGELDTEFGYLGTVTMAIGDGGDAGASGIAIDGDGKIVAAGYANDGGNNVFAVVRYNADGTPDSSFGTSGIVTTSIGTGNAVAYGTAIESDGKIVAAGYAYDSGLDSNVFVIVRYMSNGQLDHDFGIDGIVTTTQLYNNDNIFDVGMGIALNASGAIVVAGDATDGNMVFGLAEYKGDCSLASITGTVIDADTLAGISGASVALYDVTTTTTVGSVTTNGSGVYTFDSGITAGDEYIVTALALPGYTPSQLSATLTATCGTNTVGTFTFTQSEVPVSVDPLTAAIQHKYFNIVV